MVCFCLDLCHKSLLFGSLQWLGLVGVVVSSDLVLILLVGLIVLGIRLVVV